MKWLVLVIALAGVAHADDKPWAVGVSEDNKATAERLLEQGNALFLDKKYGEALERYRQALAAWDHPAIRFNIVRCLIQLDRPVEASENLTLALKYGAAPFEDTLYSEALAYQKLLANQTGDLAVACTQDGVKLALDGHELATCPAQPTRRVAPGQHQVVATRAGYLTKTIDVVVLGGMRRDVTVELDPVAKAAHVVHRWATWKPWVVFAAGVGVAAVGGVLELKASSDLGAYDRQVARECPMIACDPAQLSSVDGLRSAGRIENDVAVGMFAVGAAATVTGAVMLYLNRPQTVYPAEQRISVVPVRGGLGIAGRF